MVISQHQIQTNTKYNDDNVDNNGEQLNTRTLQRRDRTANQKIGLMRRTSHVESDVW